jgi:hypothetical protein
MKYIVVYANKGRYDRPIEFEELKTFDTYKNALDELKSRVESSYVIERLNNIIQFQKESITDGFSEQHYFRYNTKNQLVYYSNGCSSVNEYEGFTIQIFEVTNKELGLE